MLHLPRVREDQQGQGISAVFYLEYSAGHLLVIEEPVHLLLVHHRDVEGGPLIHKEALLLLGLVAIERLLPLGLGHKTHETMNMHSMRATLGRHALSHPGLGASSWVSKYKEAEK